ncbi:thioredoxin family protein [Anaerococcus hydrogenalis]|uniref:Thioredoxin n=1 Tax=Anaerococcus hydrogenalis TaxID=33029 RepID=A0A2N6UHJ7_9FIRM|nr:thioredoxin domain-containing protein [Anaerococcus hydrogenalis]MDK7695529.1 thioredoxin domain-containing protein [Anaerococcus hydrogenalis]MDK7697241.1 thioredoxin domain-containing protein [Anaerococcus hydrogenalis]MDK7708556.1 thioredoxin domain-containing protein [Anaerococcus hydrogenalis]PMC81010.1 thiol reductase thioredoxin [Anaerococcus hydrogenalis]
MKEINTSEFDTHVLENDGIVLVDFSATWCGPCKMQKPVLEQMEDQLEIYSVDVDQSPELAGRYNVNAVPSLMLFKGGVLKNTLVGFQAKEVILEEVEKLK